MCNTLREQFRIRLAATASISRLASVGIPAYGFSGVPAYIFDCNPSLDEDYVPRLRVFGAIRSYRDVAAPSFLLYGTSNNGRNDGFAHLIVSSDFHGAVCPLILREPFTIRMTAGSIVALVGVFFVVGHGLGIAITEGIWIMFICMLALSGSIILMKS